MIRRRREDSFGKARTAAEFLDKGGDFARGDALDVYFSLGEFECLFGADALFQGVGIEFGLASDLRDARGEGGRLRERQSAQILTCLPARLGSVLAGMKRRYLFALALVWSVSMNGQTVRTVRVPGESAEQTLRALVLLC